LARYASHARRVDDAKALSVDENGLARKDIAELAADSLEHE
jgi:hypothetical protein